MQNKHKPNYLSPTTSLSASTMIALTKSTMRKKGAINSTNKSMKKPNKDWMKVHNILTFYAKRKIYSNPLDTSHNMLTFLISIQEHSAMVGIEKNAKKELDQHVSSYIDSLAKRKNMSKTEVANQLTQSIKIIEKRIYQAVIETKQLSSPPMISKQNYFKINAKDAFSQILTPPLFMAAYFSNIYKAIEETKHK